MRTACNLAALLSSLLKNRRPGEIWEQDGALGLLTRFTQSFLDMIHLFPFPKKSRDGADTEGLFGGLVLPSRSP